MNAKFAGLTGLMLVLVLLLSGCNLIEIDAKMQADEDVAKLTKAYSVPVATYNGGEVTAEEAMSLFNTSYNEMYYMYQYYFGMEMSAEEVYSLMQTAMEDTLRLEIAAARFDESYALSDEELAQAEADAQAYYDEAYASLYEIAAGKDETAKDADTLVLLKEVGMDKETNHANTIRDAKAAKMEEILMAEVSELSEDDLLAAYEARLIEDEETYSLDDGSFESIMMEENPGVCWIPDGYRTVKHILLIPEDSLMNAYMDAEYALEDQEYLLEDLQFELDMLLDNDPETTSADALLRAEEDIRADIAEAEALIPELEAALAAAKEACLKDVQDVSFEIYARLENGEDFETLMAEYGEDPGMQNEPTMSRGYYVRATSANWEPNFTGGAMALEKVGDYSPAPVLSGSGAHIIYYASDVPGGPVPFEEISEELRAAALEEKKYSHCDEVMSRWIAEVNPTYDVAAFEKAIFDSAL